MTDIIKGIFFVICIVICIGSLIFIPAYFLTKYDKEKTEIEPQYSTKEPSHIVQIHSNEYGVFALCKDGSLWKRNIGGWHIIKQPDLEVETK